MYYEFTIFIKNIPRNWYLLSTHEYCLELLENMNLFILKIMVGIHTHTTDILST